MESANKNNRLPAADVCKMHWVHNINTNHASKYLSKSIMECKCIIVQYFDHEMTLKN